MASLNQLDSDSTSIKSNLTDDSQLSACYYNLAVLYYFNREYGKSLKIIEEIHNNTFNELIDEKLSRQITVMYIDVLIITNQVMSFVMTKYSEYGLQWIFRGNVMAKA